MKRNYLILVFIVGGLWLICELCPLWFHEKLPQKCRPILCHRAQIENANDLGFLPVVSHNYVIEWTPPFGGQYILLDTNRPTTKRLAFTSLLVGLVLLGLRLSRPRWLMFAVRILATLALLLAFSAVTVLVWVIKQ
jgi:hypothetical protein